MKNPSEIRSQFLNFFKERGHTIVPSAPVVPHGDPTLLFTNAGMNQFKDVFLEQGNRPYSRAVDSQKCIRVSGKHNDLEEVGPSPSHHTFFEMLGNWSFGDYYKREAICWAWELLTEVWGLDKDRLYATVFKGDEDVPFDEEAFAAWRSETGIPEERISLHGRKDNFWEMGEVGPCGPCSELHYDFGPSFCRRQNEPGHRCAVNGDCGRVVELWNLVFIQFRRDESGRLHPLPRRHVDTGAGFERILKALEGVTSNYETSIFAPIVAYVGHLSGVPYQRGVQGTPHRVAADHVRMIAFALADGVLPSNDGRGYVVRRVLRRAARFGREIGLETPFIYKLVEPLAAVMGEAYPELKARYGHITSVIRAEEESFARTLGKGLEIFGGILQGIQDRGEGQVSGEDAFKLFDTYGFPLDLTQLMARERGLSVDTLRFEQLMEIQREMGRGEKRFAASAVEVEAGLSSQFVGYDLLVVETKVLSVKQTNGQLDIVLERTPFYPEAGGQVSDQGWIEVDGVKLEVTSVTRVGDGIVQRVKLPTTPDGGNGAAPKAGSSVVARINADVRIPTQYNHTATHMLHTALRGILGKHANQAGSLVAPDRLRFDFNHFEKITDEQLEQIELMVNAAIRADYPLKWYELPYKEAVGSGITALFGEKYGEVVRVVHIGSDDKPYSRELCGGCHVNRTGELGLFRIVSEEAVSTGIRRIEAVTGETALRQTFGDRRAVRRVTEILGSHGSDPVEKLFKTLDEARLVKKELEGFVESWAQQTAEQLLTHSTEINDLKVIARLFEPMLLERLKLVGDAIRSRSHTAVALLASPSLEGTGQLCCVVGDALLKEGKVKAGDLVGKAAKLAGGGGGGRPHMATAGAKSADKLSHAVDGFFELVRAALN